MKERKKDTTKAILSVEYQVLYFLATGAALYVAKGRGGVGTREGGIGGALRGRSRAAQVSMIRGPCAGCCVALLMCCIL